MKDFSTDVYRKLLETALDIGYKFITFQQFFINDVHSSKIILNRHDVDNRPENALIFAKLEAEYQVQSTYYFRLVEKSFNEKIIEKIADHGHEIGYHYEDLTMCKGNPKLALESFKRHLDKLRTLYPVKTICMHGSPLSKWDNRKIWEFYDYKEYGIVGDAFIDIDYRKALYLTDTGRCWNGDRVAFRDKVDSVFHYNFHNTNEIIQNFKEKRLPGMLVINTHPQRWNDNVYLWIRELLMQNIKNVIKILIKFSRG